MISQARSVLLLISSIPALAYGQVKCPEPAIAAEYISPITKIKKVTCSYFGDGVVIKHGPEIEYDASGNVKKETWYNKNVPGEKPAEKKADSAYSEEDFLVLNQLLKVLAFQKVNDGEFNIHLCDTNPKTWVSAALTSQAVHKTYLFNKQCDVDGSFVASFYEPFDVIFMLRDLRGFTSTKMKVRMKINQKASGIRYSFDVLEGSVSSDKKTIYFTSHYETNINPVTGSTIYESQEGKVTLERVGHEKINITRPLIFSR